LRLFVFAMQSEIYSICSDPLLYRSASPILNSRVVLSGTEVKGGGLIVDESKLLLAVMPAAIRSGLSAREDLICLTQM
jgi:hypothetical protein